MSVPAVSFWVFLALTLFTGFVTVVSFRHGLWRQGIFNVLMCFIQVCAALYLWSGLQACVLPHPSVVEYYDGMTLCPGQSAVGSFTIDIEIPTQKEKDL